jgi:hypothetical protein
MTDNEIIKALKECEECHYYNDCEKSTRLALDLINRQKAEIEWLREQRDSYMQDATGFSIEVDKQKAEIERLKEINSLLTEAGQEWQKRCKTAKAEAVKEFAERLCEGKVSNDPVVIEVKAELKEMAESEKNV